MAHAYMFSFDLHNVRHTDVYSKIEEQLVNQFPDSVKILNTTYIIVTATGSANDLTNRIRSIFDQYVGNGLSYELFAAEMINNYQGWLKKPKWDLLKAILRKVFAYV